MIKFLSKKNVGPLKDSTIRIWDVEARRCVAAAEGHRDAVRALLPLGDGRLASGSWDGTIKVRARSGKRSGRIPYRESW